MSAENHPPSLDRVLSTISDHPGEPSILQSVLHAIERESSPLPSLAPEPLSLVFDESRAWTDDKEYISFGFTQGIPFQHKIFKDALDKVQEHTEIPMKIVRDVENADIRVSFDSSDGFWSYIGTDAREIDSCSATMNLPLGNRYFNFKMMGSVIHEILHSLGCLHEHSHPNMPYYWDKDAAIQYFKSRYGISEEAVGRDILARSQGEHIRYTEYDPMSIMHYPIKDEGLTDAGVKVVKKHKLSKIDKEGLKTLVRLVASRPEISPTDVVQPQVPVPVAENHQLDVHATHHRGVGQGTSKGRCIAARLVRSWRTFLLCGHSEPSP